MRAALIGLALVVTAAAAGPAAAEDVVVRGPGFGVGVSDGHHHDRVVVRHGDRDDYARGHCRTIIVKKPGMVKNIRKCR